MDFSAFAFEHLRGHVALAAALAVDQVQVDAAEETFGGFFAGAERSDVAKECGGVAGLGALPEGGEQCEGGSEGLLRGLLGGAIAVGLQGAGGDEGELAIGL